MQASNFGGTFDQLFLWIFLWNFHRKCLSTYSILWCKKVKNDQKLKSRGSCQTSYEKVASKPNTVQSTDRQSSRPHLLPEVYDCDLRLWCEDEKTSPGAVLSADCFLLSEIDKDYNYSYIGCFVSSKRSSLSLDLFRVFLALIEKQWESMSLGVFGHEVLRAACDPSRKKCSTKIHQLPSLFVQRRSSSILLCFGWKSQKRELEGWQGRWNWAWQLSELGLDCKWVMDSVRATCSCPQTLRYHTTKLWFSSNLINSGWEWFKIRRVGLGTT